MSGRRTFRVLICTIILVSDVAFATAQEYRSRLISISEGLPDRRVTAIAQDDQGLIWMATPLGVCRYDGYEIQNIGLPDTRATEVKKIFFASHKMYVLDQNGRIFFHHEKGFKRLDLAEYQIYDHVEEVAFDQEGYMWLVHVRSKKIYCFDPDRELLWSQEIDFPNRNPKSFKRRVLHLSDQQQIYCLDGRKGMVLFGKDGKIIKRFQVQDSTETSFYLAGLISTDTSFWVIGQHGLYRPQEDGRLTLEFDNLFQYPHLPLRHHSGRIYYGATLEQFRQIDLNAPLAVPIALSIRNYPSGSLINQLFADRQGNIWIACEIGSILISGQQSNFGSYGLDSLKIPPSISKAISKGIRSILEIDRQIYFSADGIPFLHLDPNTGEVTNLTGFFKAKDGHFHRLAVFDDYLVSGSQLTYHLQRKRLVQSTVRSTDLHAIKDQYDRLITCGSLSCSLYEQPNGQLLGTIFTAGVRSVIRDRLDRIWVCGYNGLQQISFDEKYVRQYISQDTLLRPNMDFNYEIVGSLPCKIVHDVSLLHRDTAWLATSQGLVKLHLPTGSWKQYGTDEGLSVQVVYSLLPEGDSALWLGTGAGLSRFDLRDLSVITYSVKDGIAHDEFNTSSTLIASDGYYYMGGIAGITRFKPEELLSARSQEKETPLLLRSLTVFDGEENRTYSKFSGADNAPLTLRPRDKLLTVDIALTDFSAPDENMFSFYLEGLDDKWSEPSSNHVLRYYNLAPGRYVLHAKGRQAQGAWSTDELTLPIIVQQAFVESFWFPVLMTLVASGIIFGIFTWRYRQRLKLEQLRTRISSDLHDEVGGVLSGLAMQMDLLAEDVPKEIQSKLERVALGSREAASKMRDVIWAVDHSRDHYEDLEERMKAYALEMFDPINVEFYFQSEGMSPHLRLSSEIRQNVLFIFKEAINNIVKHAKATSVSIFCNKTIEGYRLDIRDDGCGFDLQKDSTDGNGLRNMQMRAAKIGAKLEFIQDEGVLWVLHVPLT